MEECIEIPRLPSAARSRSAEGEAPLASSVQEGLQRLLRTLEAVRSGDSSVRFPVGKGGGLIDEIGRALNDVIELEDRRRRVEVEEAAILAEARRAIEGRTALEEQLAMAREAAEGASIAKRALLANISHEMRTPLGVVLGYSELLLDPEHTDLERAQWIGTILRNGRQLAALIDDILDLSKVEASRLEVEIQPVDVSDLIAKVVSGMAVIAERKGVKLRLDWQTPPCGVIESDPTRLRQILLNVVGNALKFTEQGEVAIVAKTCEAPEPRLVITVQDTGTGIDEEHVARLFQPFEQADASMTRRFGGVGVGLVLSRRLAAALGGDLELCATEPGKGSAFSVTLPLRRSVVMPARRGRLGEG